MRAYPTSVAPVLTFAQREAVEHAGGPLLVLGGAGTGKTTVLVERFAFLAERSSGVVDGPECVLALTLGDRGADALRERVEDRLAVPYEELSVTTFSGLCSRLLRDEALEAGIDPFATPVAAADRLAMLLERIDELPLRHHDLRGNPSATLGAIVRRIDRLKDELISAADYRAWADALPEGDGRGAREREFAALFAAHDAHARRGRRARRRRPRPARLRVCCGSKPHVRARLAARYTHVLVDELQDASFAQGLLLRPARRRARRHQRVRRRRPGDPPLPRRGDQERPRLPGASGRSRRSSGWTSPGARARACWPLRARCWRRSRTASRSPSRRRPARRRATWPSGAARPSAPRRRPSRRRSSG